MSDERIVHRCDKRDRQRASRPQGFDQARFRSVAERHRRECLSRHASDIVDVVRTLCANPQALNGE